MHLMFIVFAYRVKKLLNGEHCPKIIMRKESTLRYCTHQLTSNSTHSFWHFGRIILSNGRSSKRYVFKNIEGNRGDLDQHSSRRGEKEKVTRNAGWTVRWGRAIERRFKWSKRQELQLTLVDLPPKRSSLHEHQWIFSLPRRIDELLRIITDGRTNG